MKFIFYNNMRRGGGRSGRKKRESRILTFILLS
jgi:hypothetical protein